MGQVWSVRDTRLDRMVAIKISGEHFTERFEREAHNVAALVPSPCPKPWISPGKLPRNWKQRG
jgi:hypothetical protein